MPFCIVEAVITYGDIQTLVLNIDLQVWQNEAKFTVLLWTQQVSSVRLSLHILPSNTLTCQMYYLKLKNGYFQFQ